MSLILYCSVSRDWTKISKIRSDDAGNGRCNHAHIILEVVVRDSVTRLGIGEWCQLHRDVWCITILARGR